MDYITDFVCTYHLIEDLDYSDMLYKTQLMQAFIPDISNSEINIDDAFDKIDKMIEILFKKYSLNTLIIMLMDKYPNYNRELQFQMCFSYYSFYIIHKILCGIIDDNLDEDICKNLINKLNIN
ncbi:hypothetical protein ceV_114 [Chrysochromulina ericina virus CeV-01B]|uniref:Uncharacterized protein n=1 Tax=Chrysochromulina ericina virus CeV-01B TaxID=3070830 RepID=A0A0N9R3D8_9VIRU|nr:hypothetical protein ceV_114 [Chrysochromulina ericina virus]ALH23020.1 hypothetical protein ceV_114 [Chrysochromulina ericina virus CeV-01B]